MGKKYRARKGQFAPREKALWDRYTADRSHANQLALWEFHRAEITRMAYMFIARRQFPGIRVEDVLADVYIGAMGAIATYDPAQRVRFLTYAPRRIFGEILDSLREQDVASRIARSCERKRNDLVHRMSQSLGYSPTLEELCDARELTPGELSQGDIRAIHSLESAVAAHDKGDNKTKTLVELLCNHDRGPHIRALRQDIVRLLFKVLDVDLAIVMYLYYVREITMKEIGVGMGFGQSRVSQMHSQAMQTLRHSKSFETEAMAG